MLFLSVSTEFNTSSARVVYLPVIINDLVPGNLIQPARGLLFDGFGITGKLVKNILQYVFRVLGIGYPLANKIQQLAADPRIVWVDILNTLCCHFHCYRHRISCLRKGGDG